MEVVTVSLGNFIKVGVPTIAAQQAVAAARLQNLSTVSIVFSVASTINSQLAYFCKPSPSQLSNLLMYKSLHRANNDLLSIKEKGAVVAGTLGEANAVAIPR
ncbi:hypothetical protein FRC07_013693, partial [Ceratobasidium sp. 392]